MTTSIDVPSVSLPCPLRELERRLFYPSQDSDSTCSMRNDKETFSGSKFPSKSPPVKPQRQRTLTDHEEDDGEDCLVIPTPQSLFRVETSQSCVSALTFNDSLYDFDDYEHVSDDEQDPHGFDYDVTGSDVPPCAPRRQATLTLVKQKAMPDVLQNSVKLLHHDDDHDKSDSDHTPRAPRRRSTKRLSNPIGVSDVADYFGYEDVSDIRKVQSTCGPHYPKRRSTIKFGKSPTVVDLIDNDNEDEDRVTG